MRTAADIPLRFPRPARLAALFVALAGMSFAAAADLAFVPPPPLPEPAPVPAEPSQETLDTRLFDAIASFDKERLRLALNAGAHPEAELPHTPEADAVRKRFPEDPLDYYLRHEPGFTALMFAAAIGNADAVRFLLMAGADPRRLSRKSKTVALWHAAKGGHLEVMAILMGIRPGSEPAQYRVRVDLARQQAIVWKGEQIVLRTPVCSGKESTPTRPGRYLVTDKHREWISNLYEARMPFFLRLSCGDFGLHAGPMMNYPASHGCVRLPEENARRLYAMLPVGTLVEIR